MSHLHASALLAGLSLALVAPAAASNDPVVPVLPSVPSTGAENSEALERGLAAITEENIRADVHFLADDALAGRDTPSEGLRLAARYIRARLQRLGFEEGGDPGSFFHTYQLDAKRLDTEASRLTFTRGEATEELAFGKQYFFSPRGTFDHEFSGMAIFAGEGREEDVAELDLTGAFAVVHDSNLRWRSVRDNVRGRGAVGVIVTPRPDDEETTPYHVSYARWVWSARAGSLSLRDNESVASPFPMLYVVPQVRAALFGDHGPNVAPGTSLGTQVREVRVAAEGSETHTVENVAGFWPGTHPELSREVLVVSAHYDHVGRQGGEIHNGADDNGSGTSGLLALAEGLAAHGPMQRSVLLLWVSGEEKGLLGSKAWTLAPTLPAGYHAVCDVNIDMIGRNDPNELLITPTRAHPEHNGLVKLAEEFSPAEGFPSLGSCDAYWQRSDHESFATNLGIPVTFLFADVHEDYHKPGDDPEKIDCDKVRRVTRLVLRILNGLQGEVLLP